MIISAEVMNELTKEPLEIWEMTPEEEKELRTLMFEGGVAEGPYVADALIEDGYCHVKGLGTWYLSADAPWVQFSPSSKLQEAVEAGISERTDETNRPSDSPTKDSV